LTVLHADCAIALEQHPHDVRIRQHGEVRAFQRRPQECFRGADAQPVVNRELRRSEAGAHGTVDVLVEAEPRLHAGLAPRVIERMRHRRTRDEQRPLAAVVVARAELERLAALEVGKHVRVGPAVVAPRLPAVEVLRRAAVVDHAVDRARAAEQLAARIVELAAVEMFLRDGQVLPAGGPASQHDQVAGRHLDERAAVAAARFDQQHPVLRRGRQPVGEHAARRAGADDDEIVHEDPAGPVRRVGRPVGVDYPTVSRRGIIHSDDELDYSAGGPVSSPIVPS
jgi:hypothetical protein